MRIGVVFDRLNPVVSEALELLSRRGIHVERLGPGSAPSRAVTAPRPELDLAYVKTSREPGLTLAGALDAAGVPTLNAFARLSALTNKLAAAAALARAGLPTPETWLASAETVGWELARGPLVLKPCRGSRGVGVRVVRGPGEADLGRGPTLAQRFVAGDGVDRKLYVLGGRVLGLRRRPAASGVYRDWAEKAAASEPFEPDAGLATLALDCGRALGLALFGLDVIVGEAGPSVVDVNPCAGFVGVPGGAALLAEALAAAARGAAR